MRKAMPVCVLVVLVVLVVSMVPACTRPNPAYCTSSADCKDPSKPFCDVSGQFGSLMDDCIAQPPIDAAIDAPVDAPAAGCAAGSAIACSGDTLTTCAADGHTTTTTTCSLGCSDAGGSHCEQVVPSNGLQVYLDMTPFPVDLTLAGGTLDLDTSQFTPTGGSAVAIPSFTVAAPAGGASIVVFVGKKITLGELTISSDMTTGSGPAAAFLATDDLAVAGPVLVASGAVNISGCTGTTGPFTEPGGADYGGGGGGGAHATDGADGGIVPNGVAGGVHGVAAGTDELVPLRGGCPGGFSAGIAGSLGGRGGGAIQLFSLTSVDINASIIADGLVSSIADNFGGTNYGGGGGGGGILIEAPSVTLDIAGFLLARGGGGSSGDFQPLEAPDSGSPIPGAVSQVHDGTRVNGGAGGTSTTAPVAGANTAAAVSGESIVRAAGGGGGGVGRIRINTADGTFSKTGTSVLAGRVTTGVAAAH
jgi:hypothetical protein